MTTEFVFNGVKVTEEEFQTLLKESAQAMAVQEEALVKAYGISEETAGAIVYLRSRSRWTEAKEQELIERDKAGNPIALAVVLRGEF